MTYWHNPAVILQDDLALIKLIHVLGGIYIWEFLSNLGYEFSIITGQRKFTWSFPFYVGCRWCSLFSFICTLIGCNVPYKVNCQALAIATFMFGYLSMAFASALIVLRVIALWDHNIIATTIASVTWLANLGACTYCAATASGAWSGSFCITQRTEHGKIGIFSTLISDLVLLILMLFGLLRWKSGRSNLWWFLYTQGLAWVLLVTLAEVPPTIFIVLNLNDPFNLLFQVLAIVIVAIGASRIYRGLVEHTIPGHRRTEAGSKSWDKPQVVALVGVKHSETV